MATTPPGNVMKIAAFLFAASLTFFGPAAAQAKERITSAKVCGSTGCLTVNDARKASTLDGDGRVVPPPPAAGFYTVELAQGAGGRIRSTFYYVPSAATTLHAFKSGQSGPSVRRWKAIAPRAVALLREVTRGLKPFPRPRLSSVRIGAKTVVAEADSYLRLFELPSTSAAGGSLAYSESIDLRSARPTPWTDADRDLSFSPSGGLLARGGQAVRIPEALLSDLRAGRALAR
jgi:hypothetical protein